MPMRTNCSEAMGYLEYYKTMEESINKWKENFQNLLNKI